MRKQRSTGRVGVVERIEQSGTRLGLIGDRQYGKDSVQAYLEYRKIVGDRDGGVLLGDEEYQAMRREYYEQHPHEQRARQTRKMTQEEEMSHYEQRYQERRQRERQAARHGKPGSTRTAAVLANGIPLALQDMYAALGGDDDDNDDSMGVVMPWDAPSTTPAPAQRGHVVRRPPRVLAGDARGVSKSQLGKPSPDRVSSRTQPKSAPRKGALSSGSHSTQQASQQTSRRRFSDPQPLPPSHSSTGAIGKSIGGKGQGVGRKVGSTRGSAKISDARPQWRS
eukprot:m.192947 g.192947  ORF g.192947 m.192947 type:complete len:280 (+) comp14871_c0_seq2:145-984(+)